MYEFNNTIMFIVFSLYNKKETLKHILIYKCRSNK